MGQDQIEGDGELGVEVPARLEPDDAGPTIRPLKKHWRPRTVVNPDGSYAYVEQFIVPEQDIPQYLRGMPNAVEFLPGGPQRLRDGSLLDSGLGFPREADLAVDKENEIGAEVDFDWVVAMLENTAARQEHEGLWVRAPRWWARHGLSMRGRRRRGGSDFA